MQYLETIAKTLLAIWFCVFWVAVIIYGFIGVVGKMFEVIDWIAYQSP